ncbi:50S ribosomal protein L20 [Patescibacteria group bacterium]|nr:50S ribosomal protein L20 [Patescibacteria group bacterium]MBU1970247.1 50S ribosomal protein L20 [Patescibacteria group bacterium]
MRIKGGPRGHQKKVKVLTAAKGYRGARSRQFRKANEAVVRAGEHAFAGRRIRRRDIRRLWIARLNGALVEEQIKYSRFIAGLKKANILLDRKSLSELAYTDLDAFKAVVATVKPHLK